VICRLKSSRALGLAYLNKQSKSKLFIQSSFIQIGRLKPFQSTDRFCRSFFLLVSFIHHHTPHQPLLSLVVCVCEKSISSQQHCAPLPALFANDSNGAVTKTDGIVTAPASPIVDDPMFAAILGEPDAIALSLMTTGSDDVLAVAMLARELRHLAHAGQTVRLARILTAVELLIASHERELAMA
jgi:hypothetical protein